MSRKPIPSVATDFEGVLQFLKARGTIPAQPPAKMVSHAKRMHRATYSLILWKFRLKRVPEHGQVFVEEIASDALQILPQALMGYGKTTTLLIRGVIENAVRHLYFLDHPIEYARMNREHKWYPSLEELFDYPLTHHTLLVQEKKFDATNRLKTLYGELSAAVHGRRVQDLEMRASLERIAFVESTFEKHVVAVEKCAASVNFLLATLHGEQVSGFQKEDRQIILHTMPPKARQIWLGLA